MTSCRGHETHSELPTRKMSGNHALKTTTFSRENNVADEAGTITLSNIIPTNTTERDGNDTENPKFLR